MDRLNDPPSLAALAALIGARILRGDPQRPVFRLASLATAGPDDISFLAGPRFAAQARDTAAGVVMIREADPALGRGACRWLRR